MVTASHPVEWKASESTTTTTTTRTEKSNSNDTNSINNSYKSHYTLEKRLFHALHDNQIHSPTLKEFQECYAFCNAARSFFFRVRRRSNNNKNNTKQDSNNQQSPRQDFAVTASQRVPLNTGLCNVGNESIMNHKNLVSSANQTNNEGILYNNNANCNYDDEDTIRYVIDVAGGHGALGVMFLIFEAKNVNRVTIIDPAVLVSGKRGICHAWGPDDDNRIGYYDPTKVWYRHECLRTALPNEIDQILISYPTAKPSQILVVSCHACQHLSEEILQVCVAYQVHVAVLPCCQKDVTGIWKTVCCNLNKQNDGGKSTQINMDLRKAANEDHENSATDTLPKQTNEKFHEVDSKKNQFKPCQSRSSTPQEQLSIATCMDLLLAGKVMSWNNGYSDVRMKILNHSITPQNRLILCRSPYKTKMTTMKDKPHDMKKGNNALMNDTTRCYEIPNIPTESMTSGMIARERQHLKLQLAYRKAHLLPHKTISQEISRSPGTAATLITDTEIVDNEVENPIQRKLSTNEAKAIYSYSSYILERLGIQMPISIPKPGYYGLFIFFTFLICIMHTSNKEMLSQMANIGVNIIHFHGMIYFAFGTALGMLLGVILVRKV